MNFTTIETLSKWFCGMWALGLGLRMSLELILCEGWIHVPKNPINIFFDFGTLAVLGLITTLIGTRELLKKVVKEKEVL